MKSVTICFLATELLIPGTLTATTFDAVADFSSSNPSGTWAYGSGVTGSSFTPLTMFTSNGCPVDGVNVLGFSCWQAAVTVDSVPLVGTNISGNTLNFGPQKNVVLPTGVLLVHPGESSDTIVRWTAPDSGTYTISGLFETLDDHPTGIIGEVYENSTPLFRQTLLGPPAKPPDTVGGSVSFAKQPQSAVISWKSPKSTSKHTTRTGSTDQGMAQSAYPDP